MVMSNYKKMLPLFLYSFVIIACADIIPKSNDTHNEAVQKLYRQEYKDINLYPDLCKNAPYETSDYFRLAMIDMTKYFNKNHHLKRIDISFVGQYKKGISQYEFKNNQLTFVKKIKFYEGKRIASKYFLKNTKLVKCIDNGVASYNCKNEKLKILHDVKIYKDYEDKNN